ncbi:succinylglutamate desuccinylase/aspartoacylase family protein [Candidatus Bipolaricaulota bacterium]|nr:succinylglutamate desuccinylase/aspartoacylase family protein [Candidatus Bipolaricaulota bacterium]
MRRRWLPVCSGCRGFLIVSLVLALSVPALAVGPTSHDIRSGYGVTDLCWLSDYLPALANTPGDTPIYVMEGDEEGGNLLLLGGTHPNEIATAMAAILLVERGEVSCGRVFVIPHTNNSAARYNDGVRHPTSPQWIELTNSSRETRRFHYGSRYTQVQDQEPDPEVFVHYPSELELSGEEARNLNRNHPGKADGTLTQQISYALFQLVETEEIDVLIDMHESSISSRLAYTLVCHPRALEIGVLATMDLELEGIVLKVETSREEFYGLSHREFGDRTSVYAFLMETPNPGQEREIDYPDVVNDPRAPLNYRVQVQLKTALSILENYNLMSPLGVAIQVTFPFSLDDLAEADVGEYLR